MVPFWPNEFGSHDYIHRLNYIKPKAPCNKTFTFGEKQALAELRRNTDIVIKPADKGSAVIVQNRKDYILE